MFSFLTTLLLSFSFASQLPSEIHGYKPLARCENHDEGVYGESHRSYSPIWTYTFSGMTFTASIAESVLPGNNIFHFNETILSPGRSIRFVNLSDDSGNILISTIVKCKGEFIPLSDLGK